MKIRAAVLSAPGAQHPYGVSKPLSIESVDLVPPGIGEVLVKIAAAGLCHSDLSVINGDRPRPLPMALGHEASGVVESVGADVHDFEAGDHVVMVFVPSCGHCMPCASGRPALCEPGALANGRGTLLSGARRLSREGQPLNHHLGVSAFAEYAVVSSRSLVKIDRSIPLDEAALFGCAVLTGVGAVLNTAGVKPGANVAVIGLGGVGLASILGAKVAGANQIFALDIDTEKFALAKHLGATDTLDAKAENLIETVRDATGGGVDFAFEMAGSVKAMESAYRMTRRGGTTVTAGLPPPNQSFAIPHANFVAEERTVKGSYIGTCVPVRDIANYISLYRKGLLAVNELLTHRISLSEINEGFDRLHKGQAVRQVVVF